MSKSKDEILNDIEKIEQLVDQTIRSLPSGPVKDAVRVMEGIVLDQNQIMRDILERT